ncbi:glycosyltransferase family 2 protein [Paucilactobacillus suebicus]|uniref:Glycosyl transferase family protein n=1 Tax=Paucilactobacillus suebicus DSM 5007 = KCTC 3549 TaxID=1423807 RepID=A0A0R1W6Y3_9LACO|nr:glycosyltransferase family 2 protein [Paucilactobacillus suebicus]KRM13282.1 glycosyl transferase family protein [Paucilactobacillus suebicus DSM 5007 = KCTC 3549]
MEKISVIVPCFNEQETVPIFYPTVEKVFNQMNKIDRDYWFIDDGSSDGTLDELKKLHSENENKVHYISFSRNFGKEAALLAGLNSSTGDFVVVMDVDLQDPPELLPTMLNTIKNEDYDCVGTRRTSRNGEPVIRSFFANMFYKLINRISSTNIVNGARDYRMMTRQMVDSIISLKEYNRFSKGIFSWVGFKTKYIEYKNVERVAGNTSWSFWKLLKYSIDGITDFSEFPLSIASWTGFLSFLFSICFLVFIVVRAIVVPNSSVSGWASLVCIILMIGGLELLCLGIVGKYIGKIYLQSKDRPIYVVREKK